ncbi:dipeptidase PepE [Acidovorax sp. NCPPB 4044]|uniref:dipeptidase PepE n=1 Tax=Acidovorax sp. NCPPB 4044 TaxID=2940490 RepID=UPI0023036C07|nr:dipeptidase PepE [Acidovorax sp. NCPPB 4044]MDA8519194.1 dipeptidase PepE [Acidovorax sp. NCPPB 4044]
MNLLLLSNSSSDAGYLTHARGWIADWAAAQPVPGDALFMPFAGVSRGWDDYEAQVAGALAPLGLAVASAHRAADPVAAVRQARFIVVGGGNTFALLGHLRRRGLLEAIAGRVRAGEASYLGWSAGSNVACPTLRTTNDMPITDPGGFDALGLVPFQINAHYTDAHPPGHRGETREERLREFGTLNPQVPVVGLPEGTGLRVRGEAITVLGDAAPVRCFAGAGAPRQQGPGPLELPRAPAPHRPAP